MSKGNTRWRGWLAWSWLLVMLAASAHLLHFWHGANIENDILALLPDDAQDRVLGQATRRIADAGARRMVVLLGAADDEQARTATAEFRAALAQAESVQSLPFAESDALTGWFDAARAFYAPWRDRLLTEAQRQQLANTSDEVLAERALAALYGPLGAPRLTDWRSDPLNLWLAWWQERARSTGLQFDADGRLHAQGQVWAVLQLETHDSAFRLDGERRIAAALDNAVDAARKAVPKLQVLRAGVPLYAEDAAVRASFEIKLIGWGSLLAAFALVWLSFRSLRPLLLVGLSLLTGMVAALSVTALVFGKVHLLTLVFGASLVGVAVDYGIHWFAAHQGHPRLGSFALLHKLLPGMLLAVFTSVLAYLALGAAPVPGLRQMAVFSVVGLAGTFATVVCWFPWLEREPPVQTRLSTAMQAWFSHWPHVRISSGWTLVAIVAAMIAAGGLWQVRSNDDLRSLQSLPKELVAEQMQINQLLGMPSPAQFYLVRAAQPESLLQHEQALVRRLAGLVEKGAINAYLAISDWLPPAKQQQADAALVDRVETAVLARVAAATGEALTRPAFATTALTLPDWLASPASKPLRQLWLGEVEGGVASVVMVQVSGGDATLALLQAQADGLEGVRWVNRTAEYSSLLGRYREMMSVLLLAGMTLVLVALHLRYRRDAWRVALPTVLATLFTVAVLGWLGQPLQLFNVLSLLLLLGMGVDYGIFLHEHAGDPSAWVAVCLGAATTWLSFGLLALSATPALRAFGLTLLLGIGLVWAISPLLRRVP